MTRKVSSGSSRYLHLYFIKYLNILIGVPFFLFFKVCMPRSLELNIILLQTIAAGLYDVGGTNMNHTKAIYYIIISHQITLPSRVFVVGSSFEVGTYRIL